MRVLFKDNFYNERVGFIREGDECELPDDMYHEMPKQKGACIFIVPPAVITAEPAPLGGAEPVIVGDVAPKPKPQARPAAKKK
jgi:hypothetical protein